MWRGSAGCTRRQHGNGQVGRDKNLKPPGRLKSLNYSFSPCRIPLGFVCDQSETLPNENEFSISDQSTFLRDAFIFPGPTPNWCLEGNIIIKCVHVPWLEIYPLSIGSYFISIWVNITCYPEMKYVVKDFPALFHGNLFAPYGPICLCIHGGAFCRLSHHAQHT